jgi:Reverse transcriptase-like
MGTNRSLIELGTERLEASSSSGGGTLILTVERASLGHTDTRSPRRLGAQRGIVAFSGNRRGSSSESRATVLSKRRERRLAERLSKPTYVNTDACCRDGRAGLAYESALLGNRTELVLCTDSTLAEHLALLMAMRDAEGELGSRVVFRVDSAAILNPIRPNGPSVLAEVKRQVAELLKRNEEWSLVLVAREKNWPAHNLAKRPLRDSV